MTNWGHKVLVHVYVEGDMADAADASDEIVQRLDGLDVDFVGISIDEVQDKPIDQAAT